MAQMGMFTRAETLGFKVGDSVEPLRFPMVEDAYGITGRSGIAKSWYILYIDPSQRSAERVERFVARFGFTSFWPRAKSIRRVKVRKNGLKTNSRFHPVEKRVITTAVLPRYMLVEMPSDDTPFLLLDGHEARANGIVGFVAVGTEKAVLRAHLVDSLMAREAAGEFDDTVQKGRKREVKQPDWCEAGKPVRVTDGPFAGFDAVIEAILGHGQIRTTLSIFGRQARCDLEVGQVKGLACG